MSLFRLSWRDGTRHVRLVTDEEKAQLNDRPLPWRVTLGDGPHDRYWAAYAAQQKFFEANGGDTSPAQVRKFWEQYKRNGGSWNLITNTYAIGG